MSMVNKVVVLGGGSAGFLAAIALKVKLPELSVHVIRSREIGIIGVGEGSTVGLTAFLDQYLQMGFKKFFEVAQPTWKLGLRFLWGPRPNFNYNFVKGQVDGKIDGMRKCKAYYCDGDMQYEDMVSSLMTHDRVFNRLPDGNPKLHAQLAFHFENEKLVRCLEGYAAAVDVEVLDDTVVHVEAGEEGIRSLKLASGGSETADLFVDCSGFASVLLGKTLGEKFIPYNSSLFCDRAVVGGWERSDEIIKPYTTCETMQSGWAWQIEHETRINRGYVYSSAFISDDQAEREFREKNPKVSSTRIVKFISGRYERAWVKNVVAIGNACGFVEPLEATALGVIAIQSVLLCDGLLASDREILPSQQMLYNRHVAKFWDNIRDFLAIHYRFNTRLETPFWKHCQEKTDLAGASEIVQYYQEHGPSPFWAPSLVDSANQFEIGGYLTLLVGQQVPYRKPYMPSESEQRIWNMARQKNKEAAMRGLTIKETLATVRSPKWKWGNEKAGDSGRYV